MRGREGGMCERRVSDNHLDGSYLGGGMSPLSEAERIALLSICRLPHPRARSLRGKNIQLSISDHTDLTGIASRARLKLL